MYNEKLEQLIDAALADGELTEKEKQILFKKAQEMGVDLDEFEMVLDARLVKLKKAEEEKAKSSAPKSNKLGDVKKCPNCGAIVQSYQGVCGECGYAFENIGANEASKELTNLLRKAKGEKEMSKIIDTFPIPMDKGALIEFISWLAPQSLDVNNPLSKSYQKKYDEVITKAKLSFSTDKDIAPLIAQYEKNKKTLLKNNVLKTSKQLAKNKWFWIGLAIVTFLFIKIFPIIYVFSSVTMNSDKCSAEIVKAVEKGKLEKATELYANYNGTSSDLRDVASLIFSAYMEKGDIKSAENILKLTGSVLNDSWNTNRQMANQLYNYYLKNREYDKARNMIENAYESFRLWGTHIKDVVVSMCENGKKEEARRYLTQYTPLIDDRGCDKLGRNRASVVKLIKDIINTY